MGRLKLKRLLAESELDKAALRSVGAKMVSPQVKRQSVDLPCRIRECADSFARALIRTENPKFDAA
jgi:hypothetical protein